MVQDRETTAEALHRLVAVLGLRFSMASIDHRNIDQVDFLSDDFRGVVRRRIANWSGLACSCSRSSAALALATWSVQDPSFSHATNAPIRNLLGRPGAIASDLLIQIFGLASIVIVLPLAVWGWRLITHRTLEREWLRLMFWIGAIVLPPPSRPACRKAAAGRCRPALAA